MSLATYRTFRSISFAALLLAGTSFAMAQTTDSDEITRLLSQAQSNATLAHDDAVTLESYTRSLTTWEAHALQLQKMREHVNNLIGDVSQLTALRAEGSPWQQEAIDRIDPLLKSMADHLSATVQHLKDNQSRIHMAPYREFTRVNEVLADKTLSVIRDFVDYGEAKAKADSLEQKLELPTVSGEE